MRHRSSQELGAWHRVPGDCWAQEGRFGVPQHSLGHPWLHWDDGVPLPASKSQDKAK